MYPTQPQAGYPPAPQPQQPVDKTVQGILVQVEQRQNGWHRFHILQPGNQYATKADTKKPETVQQAMALMGQPVAAAIREQESNSINPHNQRPYINRYLNEIAPQGFAPGVQPNAGAAGPQGQVYTPPQTPPYQPRQPTPQPGTYYPPPAPQQPQAPQPPVEQFARQHDEVGMQIMRQAAAKVVGATWQMLPPEQQNPKGLIEACEVWMAYFVLGPLRFGIQPFSEAAQPTGQTVAQRFPAAVAYEEQQAAQASQMAADMAAAGGPAAYAAQQDGQQGAEEYLFGDPGPQHG